MTATSERRGPRNVRPQYRHAKHVPEPWVERMLHPLSWRAGHWGFFVTALTGVADLIVLFYLFNFFGLGRQFEIQMWLLIAGVLGFSAITLALYGIWFRSGRVTGIIALILALPLGAPPAWLVGNTIVQFILNGGQLPHAPIDW